MDRKSPTIDALQELEEPAQSWSGPRLPALVGQGGVLTYPHSIGFSGEQLSSYGEGSSPLDSPLIHDALSQDPP